MQTIQSSPKVFVAVPAYGQVNCSATTSSLIALTLALHQNGMAGGFGTLSYPDIVEIRNIFLSIWYDKIQTSHMLFVDADMAMEPQLVVDMVNFSVKYDKGLVGALCPKKKLPIEFAGRAKEGDCKIVDGFMEVNGVGGAMMLIRRDVVAKILEKYPECDDRITVKNHAAKDILTSQGVERMITAFEYIRINGEKFSEDLSFCHRWRACGGDVWANITHKISHIGMHEYNGCYYDQVKEHIRSPENADVNVQPLAGPPGMPADVPPSMMAAE